MVGSDQLLIVGGGQGIGAAIAAEHASGAADALREYLHGDVLLLYTVADASRAAGGTVVLLSIRHHRQLSFDFTKLWPGA